MVPYEHLTWIYEIYEIYEICGCRQSYSGVCLAVSLGALRRSTWHVSLMLVIAQLLFLGLLAVFAGEVNFLPIT